MNRAALRRVVLITLDGCGVGALPDAEGYGDAGANTLLHVAEARGGLTLPHLERLGLGNILRLPGVTPVAAPRAAWGRMAEASAGKDTTTGHWEIAGIVSEEPMPTWPRGFPDEIIAAFTRETGVAPLGNIAASGTDILRLLGEEHVRTGRPIVYTSVDSVFQIAAHEAIVPVERLYEICRIARRILDPYRIGRVIARPFVGTGPDDYRRTPHRHDFSLAPPAPTVLDALTAAGIPVFGVGKIHDIFAGQGIGEYVYSSGNRDGMAKTLRALMEMTQGLIFTNLVDFDTLYGHRRDARGFGRALEEFDRWLPDGLAALRAGDLLMITADHGCDPTTPGSDHSREYVPLLVWSPIMREGVALGSRASFADVAATIGEGFGVTATWGRGFWDELGIGAAGGSFAGRVRA